MTKRAKKATVGERLVVRYMDLTMQDPDAIALAKAIDSAIKRAVREAWICGRMAGVQSLSPGGKLALKQRIETKYNVTL